MNGSTNGHLGRHTRQSYVQRIVVTANQMGDIESRIFDAGMPVAALMEKVAGLIVQWIRRNYPVSRCPRVGVIVGPGHNGGDALVAARELHFDGYHVTMYRPFSKQKELTGHHAQYATAIGIPWADSVESLRSCDVIIDGLFGFGLTRTIEGDAAEAIAHINRWSIPVVSIDMPSGLHTDTGEVLGTAIRASQTLCLGLWKLAFLQDSALEYIGTAELVDYGIPIDDIQAVLGDSPSLQRITLDRAIAALPLHRHPATHKYKQGHLLIVCGSRQYMGASILTSLAARASGVGMLSIAVPDYLKPIVVAQVPDALIIGCPERDNGAIARLPDDTSLESYSAIACGPGLTPTAVSVVQRVLESDRPLVLDADGLNILSQLGTVSTLSPRTAPTILTPHPGEFKRLFPKIAENTSDRTDSVRSAAQQSNAIVLLKGAKVAIANDQGTVWFNPDSTPALARGGSGDVLTGLLGGLLAQATSHDLPIESVVQSATWWHSQAGLLAAQHRTELGVDAHTLIQFLIPALHATQS
ncbi:MAG: NAD(P)H-hydrate dehydratase [Elainellaceae cyanobacterium]